MGFMEDLVGQELSLGRIEGLGSMEGLWEDQGGRFCGVISGLQ